MHGGLHILVLSCGPSPDRACCINVVVYIATVRTLLNKQVCSLIQVIMVRVPQQLSAAHGVHVLPFSLCVAISFLCCSFTWIFPFCHALPLLLLLSFAHIVTYKSAMLSGLELLQGGYALSAPSDFIQGP